MVPLQDDDANSKVASSQRFIKIFKISPENYSTDEPSLREANHTNVTEKSPLRSPVS
jgi:hypothetical protein